MRKMNGKKIGTKMKYEFRVIDLSKKYFGDLVPEERMCLHLKNKNKKTT